MGPKTKRAASSDMDDQAAPALCLIELLNDDQVLDKLRRVLCPRELSAKIDSVNDHIGRLKAMLTEKEERIKCLEVKVAKLEENADSVDQYRRRAIYTSEVCPRAWHTVKTPTSWCFACSTRRWT